MAPGANNVADPHRHGRRQALSAARARAGDAAIPTIGRRPIRRKSIEGDVHGGGAEHAAPPFEALEGLAPAPPGRPSRSIGWNRSVSTANTGAPSYDAKYSAYASQSRCR